VVRHALLHLRQNSDHKLPKPQRLLNGKKGLGRFRETLLNKPLLHVILKIQAELFCLLQLGADQFGRPHVARDGGGSDRQAAGLDGPGSDDRCL
jgi:hypothetical protein